MAENVLTVNLAGDPGKEPEKSPTSSVKEILDQLKSKASSEATYAVKREFTKDAGYQYAKSIIEEVSRNTTPAKRSRAAVPDDDEKPKRSDWKMGPNGEYVPNLPPTAKAISFTPDAETIKRQSQEKVQQFTTAGIATQNLMQGGFGQKAAGAVQLAGSGLLGQKAASLAGGPVGVAVMAAGIIEEIVSKGLAAPFKALSEHVKDIGKVSTELVRNNPLGAFSAATESAAKSLENIPLVGQAAGSALRLVADSANAFSSVMNALTGRGRELAQYDPRIAGAVAQADVRKIFADMREANKMGDRYARLIDSQSRMEARLQEALLPIKEKLAKIVEDNMPLLETLLRVGVNGISLMAEILTSILDGLAQTPIIGEYIKGIRDAMKRAADEAERQRINERNNAYDAFDDLMKDLDSLQIVPPKRDEAKEAANRALKLPAFRGII